MSNHHNSLERQYVKLVLITNQLEIFIEHLHTYSATTDEWEGPYKQEDSPCPPDVCGFAVIMQGIKN